MYKILNMKFKSIIRNGDDTSSVEFEGNGTIRIDENETGYYLDYGKEHYEFHFMGEKLILKQNKSTLHFIKGERVENLYHTAYGDFPMDAYLEKCENKENGFRIVYDLYQADEKISRVYMMIITA